VTRPVTGGMLGSCGCARGIALAIGQVGRKSERGKEREIDFAGSSWFHNSLSAWVEPYSIYTALMIVCASLSRKKRERQIDSSEMLSENDNCERTLHKEQRSTPTKEKSEVKQCGARDA